jgi:hypothetical protein
MGSGAHFSMCQRRQANSHTFQDARGSRNVAREVSKDTGARSKPRVMHQRRFTWNTQGRLPFRWAIVLHYLRSKVRWGSRCQVGGPGTAHRPSPTFATASHSNSESVNHASCQNLGFEVASEMPSRAHT